MEDYRLGIDTVLTADMIRKYIETHRAEEARLNKLRDYYLGKHDILKRMQTDVTKPNNRLVNGYPKLIADTHTAFFAGEAATYTYADESSQATIDDILNYNDDAQAISQLSLDCSIYGSAYELLYHDSDANIRFKPLDARYCIPIYGNTLDNDLLYFIRYYAETDIMNGSAKTHIEVYDAYSIKRYLLDGTVVTFVGEEPHYFKDVPVCVYLNTKDAQGDFEQVITLVDAYNKISSESVNDQEYFTDAFLVLYGMEGTLAEDVSMMKTNRVLLMPNDAKADWLIKNSNAQGTEDIKDRLHRDILMFTQTPDMTDANFASNASGVAIKYKLLGLENSAGIKERFFKLGLQRRFELICNALELMSISIEYMSIGIQFHRSLPANMAEVSSFIQSVGHLLSDETQISMLGIDIDAKSEIEKRENEKEAQTALPFDVGGGEDA